MDPNQRVIVMDVKEAVGLAKNYVRDLFADELPQNIGLEEVEYDDRLEVWHITVGFSRPWEREFGAIAFPPNRSYKVVSITEAGQVKSVKNHRTADA